MTVTQMLEVLKIDLAITNPVVSEGYLEPRIHESIETILGYGVDLDLENYQDCFLVIDYAAWQYRKRADDSSQIPRNLQFRINSRVIQTAGKKGASKCC